jgi:DNA-binding protein HU-beta
MTKADIVANIANETGLEKTEVLRAVEAFMGSIKTSLSDGKNVYLRGFGSFIVKRRAQKTGRNISKKTAIIIPAHNTPSFKPSKTFIESVKRDAKVK